MEMKIFHYLIHPNNLLGTQIVRNENKIMCTLFSINTLKTHVNLKQYTDYSLRLLIKIIKMNCKLINLIHFHFYFITYLGLLSIIL